MEQPPRECPIHATETVGRRLLLCAKRSCLRGHTEVPALDELRACDHPLGPRVLCPGSARARPRERETLGVVRSERRAPHRHARPWHQFAFAVAVNAIGRASRDGTSATAGLLEAPAPAAAV